MLFDAGETLVHPAPSFAELFAAILLREGHVRDPAEVVAASEAVYERFSQAARDLELWTTSADRSRVFWLDVYGRMLTALDLPSGDGLRDVLYREFTDLANYALFGDVVPALDALDRAGVAAAIVSNFEAWLDDLLVHLGVRDRFPVRVISGFEGLEKPDPAIYRLALDRAGVGPHEAAFVGDNPEFDVEPAAALGITPVLVDRRGRHAEFRGLRITDLRELAPALEAA